MQAGRLRVGPLIGVVTALALLVAVLYVFIFSGRRSATAAEATTLHYAANADAGERSRLAGLGFDLFDTGPDADDINSLAAGQKALVWVGGDFGECRPETSFSDFTAAVDELGNNPKVFGWYLSDEPNLGGCPGLLPELKRRADDIKAHASGQKSFVVALDNGSAALAPSSSHLDLIGLDPYPCRIGSSCDQGLIASVFKAAVDAGIPGAAIVPVTAPTTTSTEVLVQVVSSTGPSSLPFTGPGPVPVPVPVIVAAGLTLLSAGFALLHDARRNAPRN